MTSDLSNQAQAHSRSSRVRLVRSDRANPFPEYRLIGLVGQGQFAQVYCAIHKQTGALAAIKQTRHAPEQPSQEPLVLGELCHPNLVCCQAIAQTRTGYQFLLDYCEAGTLRSHLEMNATSALLSLQRLIPIALDILKGLRYIHSEQVIHGDLKPENILLTYQSQPLGEISSRLVARIGDFGSARFVGLPSQSRKEIGSPTYAAPERFDGQSSQVSDLYSAGVILYELLLGDRPFSGSPEYLRQAHQTQAVPFSKRVPLSVQTFLKRSLHKCPTKRFCSADEMIDALEDLSCSGAITALERKAPYAGRSQLPAQSVDSKTYQYQGSERSQSQHQTLLDPLKVKLSTSTVKQLITASQGCFVVTDNTVYLLNAQRELRSVISLNQPSQVAISPDGSWLLALPKKGVQKSEQSLENVRGQFIGLQSFAKSIGDRTVDFEGQLPAQGNYIQTMAVDRRHILRVLTSTNAEKSFLECFTRKGKRVATLPLNISFSHAAPACEAYQMVAISAAKNFRRSRLLLISLQPFQLQSVLLSPEALCSSPRGLSAFSWGFAVIDDGGCLFLDRSACTIGRLNMAGIMAIAPLSEGKALVAISPQAAFKNVSQSDFQSKKNSPEKGSFSGEPSTLFVINLRDLGLDLIF